MAHSAHTIRVVAASVVALLLIGGAYAFSGPTPWGRVVEAQSAEELLKEYAAKDTDTDGLPDWQEALYGTDPNNPESFQAGIKDGEAVAQGLVTPRVVVRPEDELTDPSTIPGVVAGPSTVTDKFSQTLLKQYLLTRGENPPTPEEVTAFVSAALADLAQSTKQPPAFSDADVVRSSERGAEGLANYAARAEAALKSEDMDPGKNELFYFSDAVKGDSSALRKITQISDAYRASSRALMRVPVPEEARRSHLAAANALDGMADVTADFAALKTDPLRALVGLSSYDAYPLELVRALATMNSIFGAYQVTLPTGQPGADFILLVKNSQQILSEQEQH